MTMAKCDLCGEGDAVVKVTVANMEGEVQDSMALCAECYREVNETLTLKF